MKKGLIVAIVGMLLSSVVCSNAFITINWDSGAQFLDTGGTPLVDGSVIQLIWSSDNIMDAVASDGSATGNDVILLSAGTVSTFSAGWISGHDDDAFYGSDETVPAGAYDASAVGTKATLASGWVYVRVFDAQPGSIGIGTWYYQGGLIGSLTDSPGDPSGYNSTDATGGSNTAMNMQVVPEPATMALFGLGMAVLGLRRRKK